MGRHIYPKGITIKDNGNILLNKKRLLDWLNTFGGEWIELVTQSDGIPGVDKKHFIVK